MSTPQMTTAEALRSALASTIVCSAQELQEAVGQVVVATAAELPASAAAGADARSVFDPQARTTVLLVDRIPAGQEAQALAAEIERHHGRQAAQLVLGDRAAELLVGDGKLPNYTGQTNVAEKEASSKLPLALKKLVPHVLHYASMPNAHADAHRDVADARRVLADVAKDTQKVSTSIDQSSQSGEPLVLAISDAALLVEINRRGILQPLYGAIGAMHDHLDRTGALDEHLSQYLAYRLRREEAAITGMPDSAARVANWQECIDQLDREARAVKVEDSLSPGM